MIDKLPKICSYVCNSHNYPPSGQKWNHANGSLWFRKEVRPDVPVFDRIFCLNLFRIWYEINSGEAGVELLIWNFILSVHQDNWAVHGNIRVYLWADFSTQSFLAIRSNSQRLWQFLWWYLLEFILCGNASEHLSRSDFRDLITWY